MRLAEKLDWKVFTTTPAMLRLVGVCKEVGEDRSKLETQDKTELKRKAPSPKIDTYFITYFRIQ
jgi:hypothetical protein